MMRLRRQRCATLGQASARAVWRAPVKWLLLAATVAVCVVVAESPVFAQTPPGVPTLGTITPGANSLTVTWTAPDDNGGAPVTAYDLRYRETAAEGETEADWTEEAGVWSAGELSYSLTGLFDGTGYDVQMRAVNTHGDGQWSETSTPTTADHSGATSNATTLALSAAVPGRLGTARDTDVFRIVLAESTVLRVYTTGETAVAGELLDSFGTQLAENSGAYLPPNAENFSIVTPLSAGTYFIKVSRYRSTAAGSYAVHAEAVTQPGSSIATATTIELDDVIPAWLNANGEHVFKLELAAATDLWLLSVGATDTHGTLLDSSEVELASNNNSRVTGSSSGFTIRSQVQAGTYYIKVRGGGSSSSGPYTLLVRGVTDPGSTIATATPLSFRLTGAGRLQSASDEDYFRLTLRETTYAVILAQSHDHATALTPTLYDSDGNDLDVYWGTGPQWRSANREDIAFWTRRRMDPGTYYIRVSSDGGDHGAYMIHVLRSLSETRLEDLCTGFSRGRGGDEGIEDPFFGCQWHLKNTRQYSPWAGDYDIGAEEAWETTMGAGINVAVVDNELDHRHDDLRDNILTQYNHSYFGDDPRQLGPEGFSHGSSVAGIIAAGANDIGVRGVAPEANIYGYALIDITEDDADTRRGILLANAADAMTRNMDITAVSNNSWGLGGTGGVDFAPRAWELAVERGVRDGYGGKGTVYVFAGGNGAPESNANLNEFGNHYAVIAACAVEDHNRRASYSELGANLWVCAPVGDRDSPGVTTTAAWNFYDPSFLGTSAAAPIVSGVAALVRAVNEELTWRDVKLILAGSAHRNDSSDSLWKRGAYKYGSTTERYRFNHQYGFGVVNAAAAIELAETWTNVPAWRESSATSNQRLRIEDATNSGHGATVSSSVTLGPHVGFVEFIAVELAIGHSYFPNLRIELVSPSGAVSVLTTLRHPIGFEYFSLYGRPRFGSARHLGENAAGTWTLRVRDEWPVHSGVLHSWKLTAYGHGYTPFAPAIASATSGSGSVTLGWTEPDEIGSSAITRYDLRYIRKDALDKADANWTVAQGVWSSGTFSHERTGLSEGTDYEFQMRAVNDAGHGLWSATYEGSTSPVAPSLPRSPAVATRDAALAVSWRPPLTGGVGVTRYEVRHIRSDAADKADANWTTSSAGTALDYSIPNLTNDAGYDVQVRVVNAIGTSAWTATLTGTPEVLNTNPQLSSIPVGGYTVAENTRRGTLIGRVLATDDDGDDLEYSMTGPDARHFQIESSSGRVKVGTALNFENRQTYSVTVGVSDKKDTSNLADTAIDDTVTVVITVTDVNESPTVDGRTEITFPEGIEESVAHYKHGDPEDAIEWVLAGPDADAFTITDGVLSFKTPPDWEAPIDHNADNTYEVTVKAVDPDHESSLAVRVIVRERNEAPAFVDPPSPNGVANAASVAIMENASGILSTYYATDPEDDPVDFALESPDFVNNDYRAFAMDEAGVLTFKSPPDYENPADHNRDNVYEIFVTAYAGGLGRTLPVAITVVDVDEPVTLTGPATDDYTENDTRPIGRYSAADPERASITWTLSGPDADDFQLEIGGVGNKDATLRFKTTPDHDAPADADADNEYLVTVSAEAGAHTASEDVVITVTGVDEPPILRGPLTANHVEHTTGAVAEFEAVDPEGETVTWSLGGADVSLLTLEPISGTDKATVSFNDPPDREARNPNYTVTVTASDGNLSTTRTLTITVTDVNEPPVVSGPEDLTRAENSTDSIGTYTATDPESGALIWSLSGEDSGRLHADQPGARLPDGARLRGAGGPGARQLLPGHHRSVRRRQ